MLGVGEKLPDFKVTGVKPGFNAHEEDGKSAFEKITQDSFEGKWKVIFFYPKDFTFVCPTEIAEFARLAKDFEDRDAVVLGMTSYLSGVVQAPLTSAVILMEMTRDPGLVGPLLLAALLARWASGWVMPEPIYHVLSRAWRRLEPAAQPGATPA